METYNRLFLWVGVSVHLMIRQNDYAQLPACTFQESGSLPYIYQERHFAQVGCTRNATFLLVRLMTQAMLP